MSGLRGETALALLLCSPLPRAPNIAGLRGETALALLQVSPVSGLTCNSPTAAIHPLAVSFYGFALLHPCCLMRAQGAYCPCGQRRIKLATFIRGARGLRSTFRRSPRHPSMRGFHSPSNAARASNPQASPLAHRCPPQTRPRRTACRRILPGPAVREHAHGGRVCSAQPRASAPSAPRQNADARQIERRRDDEELRRYRPAARRPLRTRTRSRAAVPAQSLCCPWSTIATCRRCGDPMNPWSGRTTGTSRRAWSVSQDDAAMSAMLNNRQLVALPVTHGNARR